MADEDAERDCVTDPERDEEEVPLREGRDTEERAEAVMEGEDVGDDVGVLASHMDAERDWERDAVREGVPVPQGEPLGDSVPDTVTQGECVGLCVAERHREGVEEDEGEPQYVPEPL